MAAQCIEINFTLRPACCEAILSLDQAKSTFSVMPTSEIFSAGISTRNAESLCAHFNSPL
jgi:hypothetical protein